MIILFLLHLKKKQNIDFMYSGAILIPKILPIDIINYSPKKKLVQIEEL